MSERVRRSMAELSQLGILIYDPDVEMRGMVRGLLYGIGAREIFTLTSIDRLEEIPKSIKLSILLTNVGSSALPGQLAKSLRRGRLPMEQSLPLIAYAVRPTVALVRLSLLDWGFDEFLAFPISGHALLSKVRAVLTHPRPMVRTEDYAGPDNFRAVEMFERLAASHWLSSIG